MPATRLSQFLLAGIALLLTACAQVPESSSAPTSAPLASASGSGPSASRAPAGRLSISQWPELTIDNKAYRAAPGARIFSADNRMITPNMLPPGARVQFELDALGQVRVLRVVDAASTAPVSPTPRSAPLR